MERREYPNNKKRCNIAGLTFIIIMAGLIYFSLNSNATAGCTGDCMSCHPKLAGSKEHSSLKTCIICHTNEAKVKFSIKANTDSGCGTKCFDCHKEWPQDSAHVSLATCTSCHQK